MTAELQGICDQCGIRYAIGRYGPETDEAYTCDDCGGYVLEPDDPGYADTVEQFLALGAPRSTEVPDA